MFKKSTVKIVLFLVGLLLLTALAVENKVLAIEWNEMMCETGDYFPMSLRGVWGSSPSDVFFVGEAGHIFHYDGQYCSAMLEGQLGEITMLYDVWGTSESDVFAVGGDLGEILHFDGNGWSLMRKTKEPQTLYGVWGTASNDVFAVGEKGIILRYDGQEWSEMESPNDFFPLWGIWGTSTEDIFAVGHAGTVLHYDGISWTSMYLGTQASGTVLYDVWGSSEEDVYAVGNSGRYVNQSTGIVYHYNGANWSQVILDFSLNGLYNDGILSGVWGSSPQNVLAVGGDFLMGVGGIINYTGSQWIQMDSNIESPLFDIWGSSDKDIYVVGFGSRIYHFGGPPLVTSSSSTVQSTTSTTCNEEDPCCIEEIYGEHSETTEYLRDVRDNLLSKSQEGRELIKLYYQWSPAIVRGIQADEDFKEGIKEMVDEILPLLSQ